MAFVTVSGNVTKDAKLKTNDKGSKYITFSVADNYGKDAVQFFNCTIWGSLAEKLEPYIKKGLKCCVIGEMYLKEGKGEYGPSMMVNVAKFDFMGTAKQGDSDGGKKPAVSEQNEFDDDIPF